MARKDTKSNEIKVIELFAGVGGFRVGLERASRKYKTVWFNQWEPSESDKAQHAWRTYCAAFKLNPEKCKEEKTNTDIHKVMAHEIPDANLLVGGFPCQDYSVARTLNQAAGIQGKKGVLWWDIHRILEEKGKDAPSYLMLENVDRLLKSPAKQRGRDFAVMLGTLAKLGYIVEWRVINAADYGMPQRRRRVYILGYKKGSPLHSQAKSADPREWVLKKGVLATKFKVVSDSKTNGLEFDLSEDPKLDSDNFNKGGGPTLFADAGIMVNGHVFTIKTRFVYEDDPMTLRSVLIPEKKVPEEFYIPDNEIEKWKKLKGAKKETRITKDGHEYNYSEGPVAFPDSLDKPSRTIVTGEGGKSPSRFKHVIKVGKRYRRLTPVELEKLNTFDPDHTVSTASGAKRAFFMGNALVVDVIKGIGESLIKRIDALSQPKPLEPSRPVSKSPSRTGTPR